MILIILGVVIGVAGVVASIMILIEAFQDEIWKGVLCLLCGLYYLFYVLFDFEHENKWVLVALSLFGLGAGGGLIGAGVGMLQGSVGG